MQTFRQGYDRIVWHPLPPVEKSTPVRPARATFPTPMIASDSCDGIQSMADGRHYDSKAALRRSYRADGNPQGRDYTEIGDAPVEANPVARPDRKAIRDAADKALHDVQAGNVPEHIRNIQ